MKIKIDGATKTIPANHVLYAPLNALNSDAQRSKLYARFVELQSQAANWRLAYAGQSDKIYDIRLGNVAKYLTRELEQIAPGITEIKGQGFRAMAKYEKLSGGWKSWVENKTAVTEYWFNRCNRSAKLLGDMSLFHQLKFTEMIEKANQIYEASNEVQEGGHYLDLRTLAHPEELEALNAIGVFKLQLEAYLDAVYDGKAKLTNIHCSERSIWHEGIVHTQGRHNETAIIARQKNRNYSPTVVNLASHQKWVIWVINFLWDSSQSHRYFGFLAWLEQNPRTQELKALGYDSIPRSFGYVNYNPYDGCSISHPDVTSANAVGLGATTKAMAESGDAHLHYVREPLVVTDSTKALARLFDTDGNNILTNELPTFPTSQLQPLKLLNSLEATPMTEQANQPTEQANQPTEQLTQSDEQANQPTQQANQPTQQANQAEVNYYSFKAQKDDEGTTLVITPAIFVGDAMQTEVFFLAANIFQDTAEIAKITEFMNNAKLTVGTHFDDVADTFDTALETCVFFEFTELV